MSSLRSALEELRAEDLAGLSDEGLEDDFEELERVAQALESERLRRLAQIDRRRTFIRRGYLSASAWLADRFRMAWSQATGFVRVARALVRMPLTRQALANGEISPSGARVLVSAREANPEAFGVAESALVEAAKTLPIRGLQHSVAYWRQAIDWQESLEESERAFERRRLHVSTTVFGAVRVDGDLDPETGQTLITALRSLQDAWVHASAAEDPRTPAQRRADALAEICRRFLDGAERPAVAGERPHVTVTVDLSALQRAPGGRSELDDVGPVHPEIARRWACDASISRVITRGRSEPLEVGRRTPVVPAPIRRAVALRDRHCRFPGCDRPRSWCDAHHVIHWADGGPTSLSNLVLLCRRHHRMVHAPGGFRVEMTSESPRFFSPDGERLESGLPP